MKESKERKEAVNPAARQDPPLPPERAEKRTPNERVKPSQGAEVNPLDPGGIGE